jgi:anti-sigma-K factor RskA
VTDTDDLNGLAGEYVLGTLSADERRAAEARVLSDPAFRAMVAGWEGRLQPLADAAPAATPPANLLDRIMARIGGEAAPGGNVVALRRSLNRWRISTAAFAAAAAALVAFVVIDRNAVVPSQTEYVAVLTAEGAKPAFVATVNVEKGTLSIRRVGDAAPADKSYELWAVEGDTAPKSLGVVEASLSRAVTVPASGELTLAISLEPKGGSPTGVATGPILFTGSLVPAE